MTTSATENNWNLTEIVAASSENDISSIEVLGENVWRSFGVFFKVESFITIWRKLISYRSLPLFESGLSDRKKKQKKYVIVTTTF